MDFKIRRAGRLPTRMDLWDVRNRFPGVYPMLCLKIHYTKLQEKGRRCNALQATKNHVSQSCLPGSHNYVLFAQFLHGDIHVTVRRAFTKWGFVFLKMMFFSFTFEVIWNYNNFFSSPDAKYIFFIYPKNHYVSLLAFIQTNRSQSTKTCSVWPGFE